MHVLSEIRAICTEQSCVQELIRSWEANFGKGHFAKPFLLKWSDWFQFDEIMGSYILKMTGLLIVKTLMTTYFPLFTIISSIIHEKT